MVLFISTQQELGEIRDRLCSLKILLHFEAMVLSKIERDVVVDGAAVAQIAILRITRCRPRFCFSLCPDLHIAPN
jgi:hypothetical protein